MKAVLYNDFKQAKKLALPILIFIVSILALNFVITGKNSHQFFIQWAFIMIFTLRTQVLFGDNFKDFQKFMTMPSSLEDYSLAKIIKNLIIFILTTIVFLMGIILSGDEDKVILVDLYTNLLIALDFLAFSFSHLIFTKYKKSLVSLLYGLLIVVFGFIFGAIYMTNYERLINYKVFLIIGSIIICILSFKLDYKYSTKYLRKRW